MPLHLPTLNRHLDKLVGDLPVAFRHRSVTYGPAGCTRSPLSEDQQLMAGGLDLKLDSNLQVKADILKTPIKVGDSIIIGSDRLKAHSVKLSEDAGQLVKVVLAWDRQ